MLDITIVQNAARVPFVGAWVRNRVSDMPLSFADATRARFAEMANGGEAVSRGDLQGDEALYGRYVTWFHEQRVAFLTRVRDYLRESLGDEAVLLYTPYAQEIGPGVSGGVVADDPSRFEDIPARSWSDYVGGEGWLGSVMTPSGNWTDAACGTSYEWQHANPTVPPDLYGGIDGVLTTFPFHRTYTVEPTSGMDRYRSPSGLAMIRHYSLNEDRLDGRMGYFVSDVDRAGAYSMLAEARALANGDPRFIGYLVSHNFNRGFPEYAQAFNLAFLALPAVPSRVESGAASEPDVVLRVYPTDDHGTFAAVVNTGLTTTEVDVSLPVAGVVTDRVRGVTLETEGTTLRLTLGPAEVRALHIAAATPPVMGEDAGVMSPDGGRPPSEEPDAGSSSAGESDDGCSCRAAGTTRHEGARLGWLALAGVFFARRRYRAVLRTK